MKVFDRDGKVNFLDENNRLVGYDMWQDCCENADWFISQIKHNEIQDVRSEMDWPGFVFDPDFFEEGTLEGVDEGNSAIFRLTHPDGGEIFLHLYNIQNGYYGHGFTFEDAGRILREGTL